MSIYKKLMDARIALQSIKMKKSGLNKFAGYEYFELSDFIPHVQKIFHEIGLCGVVSYEQSLATLTITNIDDCAQQIVITSPMSDANLKGCHPVQNLGAVETYQRRYLWVTAMEILEHDALDSSRPKDEDESKTQSKTLAPYPLKDFDANKSEWRKIVESGKKTAEQLIAIITTKGTLTDDQEKEILSWDKQPEASIS